MHSFVAQLSLAALVGLATGYASHVITPSRSAPLSSTIRTRPVLNLTAPIAATPNSTAIPSTPVASKTQRTAPLFGMGNLVTTMHGRGRGSGSGSGMSSEFTLPPCEECFGHGTRPDSNPACKYGCRARSLPTTKQYQGQHTTTATNTTVDDQHSRGNSMIASRIATQRPTSHATVKYRDAGSLQAPTDKMDDEWPTGTAHLDASPKSNDTTTIGETSSSVDWGLVGIAGIGSLLLLAACTAVWRATHKKDRLYRTSSFSVHPFVVVDMCTSRT